MTLEQWKAIYYAIPASEAVGSDAEALEHSLWKWIGFREKTPQGFNGMGTCALCRRYYTSVSGCLGCPLGRAGKSCAEVNSPYGIFDKTGNPEPMIEALAELLDIELAKEEI